MTNREWIKGILAGESDWPVAQHWMGYFNSSTAKRLTPAECHYTNMWWYDVGKEFDPGPMGTGQLEAMIRFNDYTGRCFACLGKGANISWGHGGPGEFFVRIKEQFENGFIAEFETGVCVEIRHKPHFYKSFNHPVNSPETAQELILPDPADPGRYHGFASDAAFLKSRGEYVVASLNGFFSGLHYFLYDYQQTLMGFILEPELVNTLLEKLGHWNLEAARQLVINGADCITFCEDLGSKEAPLLSPDLYRKFIKPWHQKLCETVHDLGATVHLHCHGAVQPIFDDIVECGFDFINPFDPEEGWEIEEVLQKYGDRFVAVGGFPTSFWYWPAKKQEQYLEEMAALARKYKRFIFMDSGGVPEDLSREDHERLLAVSRKVRGVEDHSNLK